MLGGPQQGGVKIALSLGSFPAAVGSKEAGWVLTLLFVEEEMGFEV